MDTEFKAKWQYWSSEEYGKIIDARGELQDTLFKMMDECEKLWPVIKVLTVKLGDWDNTVQELTNIDDAISKLSSDVMDRLWDLSQAIG